MLRRFEEIYKEKEEKEKIAQLPSNRNLKYLALVIISVGIALLLIMVIWYDSLSPKAFLALRGSAGACAIIFAIIVTIYMYRVNTAFSKQKYKRMKETGTDVIIENTEETKE